MKRIKHTKRTNPERFQGRLDGKDYFEGWYYKQVDQTGRHTIAFIPGVSLDSEDTHCFIQVIVSPEVKTYYYRFPLSAFKVEDEPFKITIGDNVFTLNDMQISLGDDFNGSYQFGAFSDIDKSLLSPDIMGFFSYIPGMECNHGVISMNHSISGHMRIPSGENIDFEGGKGYIEKDWGRSFPKSYVWLQANQFEDFDTSFMCSIATIPFGFLAFDGLIANLKYKGKEYRFATYNGAKVRGFKATETSVTFKLIKGKVILKVTAVVEGHGQLKAPLQGEMVRTIKEGLGGEVTLALSIDGGECVNLSSSCAGIEIALQGRLANGDS